MTGELGSFLRARRSSADVAAAGVPSYGHRRVPGLRREEVAALAGVNVDYYARLEQGRERHPSAQVVDALARALRLDPEARSHLFRLAGVVPAGRPSRRSERVGPQLLQLIDGWPGDPTLVLDRRLDVLAANTLATALFSPFTSTDNLVRMTFLDPAGRTFNTDWERAALSTVASLRLATAEDPRHPRLLALVAEVGAASAEFRDLWESQAVRGLPVDTKDFVHPVVGALELTTHTFVVAGTPEQRMVVLSAQPGSRSAQALDLLRSLTPAGRVPDLGGENP